MKTASKREIKKKKTAGETTEATGDLIDNKLADIRASFSKKQQKQKYQKKYIYLQKKGNKLHDNI